MSTQKLRELALAATQGEWRNCGSERGGCSCGTVLATDIDFPVAECRIDDDEIGRAPLDAVRANAAYIAAACPANILALIDSHDALLDIANECQKIIKELCACYSHHEPLATLERIAAITAAEALT